SVVRIEGTVAAGAVAVDVNGIPAEVAGGRFRIDSFGLHDGVNELVATARDAAGNLGTAALRVLADTVPPRLSIGYPADGARLDAAEVAVTGRISDLAIGTINATEVAVTVNGVPATIANRSFAAHLTLAPGENAITAEAVDRAGQRATASVRVRYEPPAGRPTVAVLSGDGQAAPVSSPLPAPLAVAVRDAAGQPLAGTQVIFRVVAGDGLLGDGRRAAVVATDASGEARASWTIGRRAGAGVNRVRATALGVPGEAQFCASATAGAPAAIHVASGDRQRGAIGDELPLPLFAVVYDAQGNPIEGVAVTFRVTSGGGLLAGGAPEGLATATTDGSGLAHLRFTLGPEPGLDDQIVEATAAGLDGRSALFTASAFAAGDPAATALAGVVLDNQGAPVPGVTLRIRDTTLSTRADGEGQFRLTGVPVGRAFLLVDASTASRPGTWASLEFEIFPVAGIENVLERPIHILPLDLAGGAFVDETHGGTVTLPDVPGFALEVAPGSVTFPGGGRGGVISVTAVHADSIPMAPGAGMQPRLIVTIQPAGALFDPPARMRLPNVDGLPAGAVTELFSFDHDIGAFVAIGTGTVAEDGLTIQSDPGFGVLKAGWHCGTPPSTGGACSTLDVDITNDEPILVPLPDDPQAPASGSGITAAAGAPPDVEVEATGAPSPDADYGWESGDPALLDMDPIGNGYCVNMARCASKLKAKLTGRTRVKVRHRSRTTNKVVEESKDVMVVKATITDVYSEQQPGRECNKLPVRPDLLMPGANQPMIVAAVSGYDVEISIKTKIDPPAAEPYVRVGVRKVDPFHDDVLADAPAVNDGKAKVRFIGISPEDGPHATRFEPVVGIDMNRNGKLDPDEVTGTFGNDDAHRIRVVSAGSYTVNLSEVHGREFLFNGFVLQPIGREVLQTFLGERQAPAEAQAGSVDITPGFAGLTHPFGMTWDAQCHATIADFSYGTNTGVAQEVAEAGPVVAAVQRELDRHKADVQAFFARPGSPNVAFLPADLGQPAAWTWQGDVGFRAWLTSLHPSLAVAFGSVTIRGTIPIVEVEKSGLKVRRIAYNGGFQDLYDFNYDMDICRPQAILQAGFGSLGQAGRIFNNRLQFSTQGTPAYMIGGFNYSFK
ncbi:MAG TPA: carboxypeptidase regulatory-like domain-containing protein, partial [Thermoanaerobaculia bacterium]|nr:carboxypeptidase regulatory-like domain-containing protein [Thermoanaerobaculia bacterium]